MISYQSPVSESMIVRLTALAGLAILLALGPAAASAGSADEFKARRQEVFEFAEKPALKRDGGNVEIRFASKAFCDATVAIEDSDGRIVRHLVSGVLGANAPEPFTKDSLSQAVVWDGKDDRGAYVDNTAGLTVRVSLGLKPVFERTLFWSPQKRSGWNSPVMAAAPEGVYVFEGGVLDRLRLFDHDGNYVRTIYPFARDKLDKVTGLRTRAFAQDGQTLPNKMGFHRAGLLTSGSNDDTNGKGEGMGAKSMAVRDGRIALVMRSLNRLSTDGTTGAAGRNLSGPKTCYTGKLGGYGPKGDCDVGPRSIAFSPDGKWVYMTGYDWNKSYPDLIHWLHGLVRVAYDGDAEPEVLVGGMKEGHDQAGSDNAHFRVPAAVACDSKGRVYVADHMNDRVQVFDADGKYLKTIPIKKPAHIIIHRRTDEIYIFSWMLWNRFGSDKEKIDAVLTRLGTFDDPTVKAAYSLPFIGYSPAMTFLCSQNLQFKVELDSWADRLTLWVIPGATGGMQFNDDGSIRGVSSSWDKTGLRILVEEGGKLVEKRDFGNDVRNSVVRLAPPILWRQRLYVNPKTERLYVGEGDSGVMKSFKELVEIDPATGQIKLFDLPFTAEDIAFDQTGRIYMRTDTEVVRYDPVTWREIPWDYGEEKETVGFDGSVKSARKITAALTNPGNRPVCFHAGGMGVAPDGSIAMACSNPHAMPELRRGEAPPASIPRGRPYTPNGFPGRVRWGEVHVWDEHGKPRFQDAVPGLHICDGLAIDRGGNLYAMMGAARLIDGKPNVNPMSETLAKFPPGKAKIIGTSGAAVVPLTKDARPDRPPDMQNAPLGTIWAEGAQWLYGGLGFGGFNHSAAGGGCACWNARFALDYFARSFAPETEHYSVAVLDTNGNLILRVGRYGNVDDGRPLIADGGPAKPRSIGGDEVALFHACYVAAHTDRRLFIADAGNARIVSVKLDYHQTEKVGLGDAR